MSPLAIKNSTNLKINEFDLNSIFFSNSNLFHRYTIEEEQKIFLEKIFAIILIFLLSPILIIAALLIRMTMGQGVLYTQTRVGKNGKHFLIYKFRTMVLDAETKTGAILSTKNDPRVTTLGKIFRASHIDEFPQLINVLKGDMSFIGPRPERPEFVNKFVEEIEGYRLRHEVKPGITGLAQICLPYDASAYEKLEYDRYYIENRHSIIFNLVIGFYTALKMVTFFDQ